jgi:hypothetical protein
MVENIRVYMIYLNLIRCLEKELSVLYKMIRMPFKDIRCKLSSKKTDSPLPLTPEKQPLFERWVTNSSFTKGGKKRLVKSTTHRDTLKDDEVYVQVTHSGICVTDRFARVRRWLWFMKV